MTQVMAKAKETRLGVVMLLPIASDDGVDIISSCI
jgi:hypothetical protein